MDLRHPNVVSLIGYTSGPSFCFISPWYPNGNVRRFLQTHPGSDRLKLIQDVACGVSYLHSRHPAVVHGDLKADNVFISEDGHAMLTDFGLSTALEGVPSSTTSHRQGGSMRWMAPELVRDAHRFRSCVTDIYAFGSLTFEILTGEFPYGSLSTDVQIILAINAGQEPVSDREMYPQLRGLMGDLVYDCWSAEIGNRPPIHQINSRLCQLNESPLRSAGTL